jgi:hemerythrin-like domain-containing protein
MKDTTPIKRHQALVAFSKDHHFGLLLVWKIKQGLATAVETERISNYILYFFEEYLLQHFQEEEQRLFPKLPKDNALRQQAEKEHELIYSILGQLRHEMHDENLVIQFAQTLKSHIRFEERELFAFLQGSLTESELEAITSDSRSPGIIEDSRWQDMFWVIDKPGT